MYPSNELNYIAEKLEEDVFASPCSPSQKPLQTPLSNLAGATDLSFVTELNCGPELMAVSQPQQCVAGGRSAHRRAISVPAAMITLPWTKTPASARFAACVR